MYINKLPDDSVNVSNENFLIETAKLVFSLVLIVAILYFALQVSINVIANNINPSYEKKLQVFFKNDILYDYDDNRTLYLQSISDDINHCADLPYDIRISVSDDSQENAFALLGGDIVITTGMLDSLKNENELAFVIGHEIGHFKNKDHIKGLGNSLVLAFISMFIGADYEDIFSISTTITGAEFSQVQEIDADLFAIDMMMCKYKNVVGATTLFSRMSEKDSSSHFLSSHPDFSERISIMKSKINDSKFPNKGKIVKLKYWLCIYI